MMADQSAVERVREYLAQNHPFRHPPECMQVFAEPDKGPCVCGLDAAREAFEEVVGVVDKRTEGQSTRQEETKEEEEARQEIIPRATAAEVQPMRKTHKDRTRQRKRERKFQREQAMGFGDWVDG